MAVTLFFLATLLKLNWDLQYFKGYSAAIPLNVQIRSEEDRDTYHRVNFTYEAFAGRSVPALMAAPLKGKGPFPAVVFLHGIGQKKEFLDEIGGAFTQAGFIIVTFDQYMQGERKLKNANWATQARALRGRGSLTVNEARRMVDYLQTLPDVAKDRIYLIGASYGAMTGAIAAAFDKRFKAVTLCYGGGDFRKMAGSRGLAPVRALGGSVVEWLAWISDPVNYVGLISPRPVLFQNGDRDRIVVPEAARALQEAAGEPKEIKWYPSDHLDLSPEYIPIAVKDGIAWFKAQDAKILAAKGGA